MKLLFSLFLLTLPSSTLSFAPGPIAKTRSTHQQLAAWTNPFGRKNKKESLVPDEDDEPKAEGAEEFCRKCGACARKCPAGAISSADEPDWETPSPSNNPGVLRWPVDADRCYCFWVENGSDCSTCIAVCPYGR